MYTKEFKDFVEKGIEYNEYIGLGNPNAKILFVGKESSISKKEYLEAFNKNNLEWKNHILNNTKQIECYEVDENHIFRKNNQWGKNTWSKYQLLKNLFYRFFTKSFYY